MWLLRILKVVAVLTPFVPARFGYRICSVIGFVFYLGNSRARRNVISNLRHVDPSSPWLARQRMALRVSKTVVTNYYDLLRIRSVDRDSILNDVQLRGLENVQDALRDGRGVIIVSGHIGNFSVMARLPAALGIRTALVAERVEPPQLFNYMTRLRSSMGVDVIPPGSPALRNILSILKQNGIVLLATDRDVTNQGVPVEFFGKVTRLPAGPVALAMRTGAALIPAFTLRNSQNASTVEIQKPLELRITGCWDEDVTANVQLVAQVLEEMIRADPGQWAVLQRVWPPTTSYGRSEALGSADELVSPGQVSNANAAGNQIDQARESTFTTR